MPYVAEVLDTIMKILITNDDGINAEGLRVLAIELRKNHEVWIFAPDQERSGVSHAMTLKSPGKVKKIGDREYSCSGTPADCVILSSLGVLPFRPDIIVSGINRGPNLGTDIIYSGTCGAARQAALHGIPGIAVSCATYKEPFLYAASAFFVSQHLEEIVNRCSPGMFININAPSSEAQNLIGRWAKPCERRYNDKLSSFEAPDGSMYCFLHDSHIVTTDSDASDHSIVTSGDVSISAILVAPQTSAAFIAGTVFA